jgi:hypothetical protein
MTRQRNVLTVTAMLMVVMALVPAASADSGTPLRTDVTATFIGTGWITTTAGDLDCGGITEESNIRFVGEEPFVDGAMHWHQTLELTCPDGTLRLESQGRWVFDNGNVRLNGTVTAATGAYEHLVGASAHQKGYVDPSTLPFLTFAGSLRIN